MRECGDGAAARDKAFLAPEGKNDGGENSAAEREREERCRMLNNAKLQFPVHNEQTGAGARNVDVVVRYGGSV